jgi:uncharacterized protein (TIGR02453 family)
VRASIRSWTETNEALQLAAVAPDVAQRSFEPALFRFLRDLKANNDREWFASNKSRYEQDVRDQALDFVEDMAPHLESISPHFVADPRPSGGSLFRIHRDTRFSKDKSPYKTYTGIQFRHELGKDAHAPGFYLHLQPEEVFVGAGMWHPDAPTLARVREAIAGDPKVWAAAKRVGEGFRLVGESLKRAPSGYDPEHALIEDLKRKDFICVASLTEKEVCAQGFVEEFAAMCRRAVPLVRFLCTAIDAPF